MREDGLVWGFFGLCSKMKYWSGKRSRKEVRLVIVIWNLKDNVYRGYKDELYYYFFYWLFFCFGINWRERGLNGYGNEWFNIGRKDVWVSYVYCVIFYG